MKKLLLLLFVLVGITVNAQSVGGGVTLVDGSTAIELNAEFAFVDGLITASPSFDYFIGLNEGVSMFTFNLDGHYNLGDVDGLNYYPIVGIGYHSYSFTLSNEQQAVYENAGMEVPDLSSSSIGINIGGGASYSLSESMKLLGELRYATQKGGGNLGIILGVLFSFGG